MRLAEEPEFSNTVLNAMGLADKPKHISMLSAKSYGTKPWSVKEGAAAKGKGKEEQDNTESNNKAKGGKEGATTNQDMPPPCSDKNANAKGSKEMRASAKRRDRPKSQGTTGEQNMTNTKESKIQLAPTQDMTRPTGKREQYQAKTPQQRKTGKGALAEEGGHTSSEFFLP